MPGDYGVGGYGPGGYRLGMSGGEPVSVVPPLPVAPAHNVIDSFRLVDGVVSGLELHVARFLRSLSAVCPGGCPIAGLPVAVVVDMVRACLPMVGEWFPRLECHAADRAGAGTIYVNVRSAPQRRSVTRLWVPSGPDPRERPVIKGWDLPALTSLRAAATRRGWDDAILVDSVTGHAVETTTGVLVVWVGESLVTASSGVLPSVTWQRTEPGVRAAGIRVVSDTVSISQLRGLPCVVGNALHGWTPVVAVGDERAVTRLPTPPVDLRQFLR